MPARSSPRPVRRESGMSSRGSGGTYMSSNRARAGAVRWLVFLVGGTIGFSSSVVRAQAIAHWSFDNQNAGQYADETGNHTATVVTNGTGAISSGSGVFGNAAAF